MKKYYYMQIESNEGTITNASIISGPVYLPKNYKNVSNFSDISDDSLLINLEWMGDSDKAFWEAIYPETTPSTSSTQKLIENTSVNISNSTVDVTFSIVEMSSDEINEKIENYKTEWKEHRNRLLFLTDFTQLPDVPLTDQVKSNFAIYRENLRNLFDVATVEDIVWPEPPSGSNIDFDQYYIPN